MDNKDLKAFKGENMDRIVGPDGWVEEALKLWHKKKETELMTNKDLKAKYNEMYSQGQSAWFDSGDIERQAILEIGEPWDGLKVLEIGCGEGGLVFSIAAHRNMEVHGIDYSKEAIRKARESGTKLLNCRAYGKSNHRIWNMAFSECDYRDVKQTYDRIVMQGVLEHLDKPFEELQWMIEYFKPKTVITSSPAFLNPRGIIWMTLDMLGAVMSKTDLHYLHEWDFREFCHKYGYDLEIESVDFKWASGPKMIEDLWKRIPLALKDGKIPFDALDLAVFMDWLSRLTAEYDDDPAHNGGATNVYRIDVEG